MNITDFVWSLGRNSAQAAVLVVIILAVQGVFRRRLTPQWRAALWLLLVARLLLPLSSSSAVSIFNWVHWRPTAPAVKAVEAERPAPIAPIRPSGANEMPASRAQPTKAGSATPFEATPAFKTARERPASFDAAPSVSLPVETTSRMSLTSAIFGAWLAGVIVLSIHLGWTAWRLRRRLSGAPTISDPRVISALGRCAEELGVTDVPPVLEAEFLSSPALHGFWHPVLLLPRGFAEQFSARELRFVLLHELAHLKRRDLVLNWIMALLQVAHWFNPLVWFGFARWRADREIACDALALGVVGAENGPDYGETILRLLDNFSLQGNGPTMVCVLEDKTQLRRRIQMIARFRPASRWSTLAAVLLGAIGVVCLTDAQVAPPAVPPKAPIAMAREPNAPRPPEPEALALDLTPFGRALNAADSVAHLYDAIAGHPTFDGLPFNLNAAVILFGDLDGAMCGFPEQVTGIPVGRTFDELHLLHITRNYEAPGTVVARIRLNYADGSQHEFPIRYAYEVRKHTHWINERQETLLDKTNSKIVWRSANRGTGRNSNSRLIETTFRNPYPDREVVSLDAITTHSLASYALLGATVARANPARAVTPGLAGQDGDAPLRNSFVVTVLDANGKPVRDARVLPEYVNNATDIQATDEKGQAVVPYGSKTRQLTISVHVHGFPMVRGTWTPDYPAGAEFRLVKGTTIGGVVVDEAGKPKAGVLVTAFSVGANEGDGPRPVVDSLAARTDVAGRWMIAGVPDGFKSFLVTVVEGSIRTNFFADTVAREARSPDAMIIKAADFFAESATLRMPRSDAVNGLVENEAGKPIAGATIYAGLKTNGRAEFTVRSDEKGQFAVQGIRAGTNLLVVKADGYAPSVTEIEVPPKVVPHIQLPREQPLAGRVTDRTGAPIPGVIVQFAGAAEAWSQGMLGSVGWQGTTNEKGEFNWPGAPIGAFRVSATKHELMTQPWVRVDASNRSALQITMTPQLLITGVVTDADSGDPVNNFQVVPGLISGSDTPDLDSERAFKSTNLKGRYKLNINRPAYYTDQATSFAVAILAEGYEPAYSRAIKSDEGEIVIDFKLKQVALLTGTVVTAGGKPVAGASVVQVDDPSSLTLSGVRVGDIRGISKPKTTDAGGNFSLTPNAPSYHIAVACDAGFALVSAAAFKREPKITVQPWATVDGVWTDWDQPISRMAVRLAVTDQEGEQFNLEPSSVDEGGKFHVEHVPPGAIIVYGAPLNRPWMQNEIWREDVASGAAVSLKIATQLHAVTVRLKNAAGVPAEISVQDGYAALRAQAIEPEPPPEVDTPEKLRQWAKAFRESEAGKKMLALQSRPRGLTISPDWVARGELLPSGTYRLEARLFRNRREVASTESVTITIPAQRETAPIDLGELLLKPTAPQVEPASNKTATNP